MLIFKRGNRLGEISFYNGHMVVVGQKDDILGLLNFGNEAGWFELGACSTYHVDPFWWHVVGEWILDDVCIWWGIGGCGVK